MTVRVHCRVYFPVAIAALGAAVMTAAPGCTSGPPPPVDERPYEERVVADRARKDAEFRAPDNKFSPVPQEKRAGFPALAYYPVRAEYRAPAALTEIRSDPPVVIELPVVWGEMDSYRHVNNVVYFRYFESARLEYFNRLGWFDFEKETGVGPILAATLARFRKPLTYPDTVAVGAHISALAEDRFTMDHVLVSRKLGAVAAEGQSTVVTFQYGEGRKVPIPDELRRRIAELEMSAHRG